MADSPDQSAVEYVLATWPPLPPERWIEGDIVYQATPLIDVEPVFGPILPQPHHISAD